MLHATKTIKPGGLYHEKLSLRYIVQTKSAYVLSRSLNSAGQ